ISFYDLDHDVNILNASMTPTWAYGCSSYAILGDGRFNITLQTTGISATGQVSAQFTFTKTFYLSKTSTVYLTIRLISTSGFSTNPSPAIVPVGDTTTFDIIYFDTDHQLNITDGDIDTNWAYDWNSTRAADGSFRIILYTTGVANLIQYTVSFTLTKTDHANAIVNVRIEVRPIKTSVTVSFPSTLVAGINVSVTVTYEDLDHNSGITGASIITDTPGGLYTWAELEFGQYNVTFFLWNQPPGTYSYDITALRSNYDPASILVDLVLPQVGTELTADVSIIQVNWSEYIDLVVYYDNSDVGGLVLDADVSATLSGVEFVMTSSGSSYDISIDSAQFNAGTFLMTINATKTNHEPRLMQITVVISVLETSFESLGDVYSVSVVSGESFNITVYYESLAFGAVSGASVSYSWDYGSGVMVTTGKAGYYTAIVDTTDTPVNVYTLYVRANKTHHVEASIYFSVDVGLVDTDLTPVGEATLRVVYGESAILQVNYTNVNLNIPVPGGSLLFKFGDSNLTGTLTESTPGIYNATIETAQLYAGTFSMYIVATKAGYETRTLSMLLEVQRIDTSVIAMNVTASMIYEQTTEIFFNYTDTHYGLPIENATLEYRWQGSTGLLEDLGNGIYKMLIDSTEVIPGVYDVYVTASKGNYVTRTSQSTVQVQPIEMEIVVNNFYDIAIGDPLTIEVQILDTSYNRTVEGIEGSIFWTGLSLILTPVEGVAGNYTFVIPDNTGLNSYDITILVNKLYHRSVSTIITVLVRPIATTLTTLSGNNFVSAVNGEYLTLIVEYMDIDHNEPISGADLYLTQASNIISEDNYVLTPGPEAGQYAFAFTVPVDYEFEIVIHASNGQEYQQVDIQITVVATPPTQDPLQVIITYGGFGGIILILLGTLLWMKVFSVPKLIRIMNGMIKKVSKGVVPENPECSQRNQILHDIINEGLEPVGIYKPIDEIPLYSVDFHVPETETLLAELAVITGLEESDVAAFRADLARMKPSERPGFLNEVIKQEKARRAEELAEKTPEKVDATRIVTPEELEEVGERLLKMGLSQEQVDDVLESAKEMTRAELETVLEQLDDSMNQ
ncbi:MAG: hypothetical protein P1Q69_16080, partial [Candidatus Thorarchaeota archaeon]|nr:hypothetical protein [Candidatus Thorarchaeota archaeon]